MKNSQKVNGKLNINKFQISKILNLHTVVGGNGENSTGNDPLKTRPTISK